MPRYTSVVVALAATLWLLIQARSVLQPFVLAVFIWFLLNAMASASARILHGRDATPTRAARALSTLFFICLIGVLAVMTANNASALGAELGTYERNLDALIASAAQMVGIEETVQIGELVRNIDIAGTAVGLAGSAASYFGVVIIVIVYLLFLFVEDEVASQKLAAIVTRPDQREDVTRLLRQINREVERYFGVKLIVGVLQAVPTYLVLRLVGVDGAAFWAILIFFFSFVPTIGTLIGIVFPSLMALVQFDTLGPFVIVLSVLGVVQLAGSNWLEPRLMGSSLNLSPLAILLAIFAGGAIWGIVGALIIVPLLVVAVIVFARIPSMRPVAVLLSRDGVVGGAVDGAAGGPEPPLREEAAANRP